MNRSSTPLQLIARAASLALAAALLAPAAANADALPLRIGDPTAYEKPASGIFCSYGEGNVRQSLSLDAEMRWGNDCMHARYYSPDLGRFLSVDPVGGTVGSSQSWNRYSYVENNPIGFVDPRGEASLGAMTSWIEADPAGYNRAGRKSFYSLMLAGSEAQYGFYPSFALSGSTVAEGLKNMFGAGIRGLDWFSIDLYDLQRSDGTSLISVDFTSSWLAGFGASAEFESRGFLISPPKNIYLNWLWLKTDFGLGGKPNMLDAGARVGPVGGNFSLNLDSVLTTFFEYSMFSSFEDTESRFESEFGLGDQLILEDPPQREDGEEDGPAGWTFH